MVGLAWRVLERRLRRYLPPERVLPILGDLCGDHERYAREHGRVRARLWLARAMASLVAAYRRRAPLTRGPMDKLRSDLIHAWRALRARPGAALATAGVLSLGIGLVSSMFALADPYVTRALPFADADRLVTLSVGTRETTDVPTIEGLRARTDLFAGLAAFDTGDPVSVGPGGETTLRLLQVSQEYFQVLGVAEPPEADWRARPQAAETPVVLTAAASRRVGELGRPGSLLRIIDDAGAPTGRGLRVRDTFAPSFLFPSSSQLWDGIVPLPDGATLVAVERSPAGLLSTRVRLSLLARLQPGVTLEQVAAGLTTAPPGDSPVLPSRGRVVTAYSVSESMTGRLRPLAAGALGAGVLVLLVCAANVANLLIARGAFRRRELATREALGATAADLGRLVLAEVGLLAVVGVIGGLGVAGAVLAILTQVIPERYVVLGAPDVSARVVAFAAMAGTIVAAAGLLPATAAWRVRASALFGQAASGEPRRVRAARFSMTAAQTAVAVVLLVGAMLMARSYVNLLAQDPGYAGDVFAVGVRYPANQVDWRADVEATVARLRRIDGVQSAAAMKGWLVENIGGGFAAPAVFVDGQQVRGLIKSVGPDFFQTVRGRLIEGRLLAPADENQAAVVSQSFARACCEGRSPIGRRVSWRERSVERSVRIVGVVKDVFDIALDREPTPAAFIPIDDRTRGMATYVLVARRPGPALAAAVDHEILAVNPGAVVADGGLMRDRLMRSIHDRSFATLIVIFFGVAAIGVSAAGLIGVVGSVVARRTREIAIRMAIGADRTDVRRLVTREAVLASGLGAAVGLSAGGWLSKTMESFLYGVSPADPLSMALAAAALMAIVVAAAWVPARRAMRLSPADALRAE
jgi:predicted permease